METAPAHVPRPTVPDAAARRRRVVRIGLGVALLAVAALGAWWALSPPFYHWTEVVPGQVYRSGLLEDDLGDAIDRYRLKTILNVRSVEERAEGDWYEPEKATAKAHGAEVVDVPIPRGMPPTPEQVETLLSLFDDPARRPILMHCQHGVTRSAAVEALFRREFLGEDGPTALARVSNWKPDLASKYPLIADFIRTYVPRKDRAARQP